MRAVTRDDADELAKLDMELFPSNCFNETTLGNEVELGFGWVEVHDGKLIGYVLVRTDDRILDITRLGVHPFYQNMGIGTRLLRAVLDMKRPTMLTVSAKNEVALRLYRHFGFEPAGLLTDSDWVLRTSS